MTKTELEASTLNTEQLNALKSELDVLYESVTSRVEALIQENSLLADWTEVGVLLRLYA
mgnify:CR=1 FL=1